jgi:putative membrane protein
VIHQFTTTAVQKTVSGGGKQLHSTTDPQNGNTTMLKTLALIITVAAGAALTNLHAEDKSSAAVPNDAQIAMIAVTANSVDIDAGKIAAQKSQNADVKGLAELMVRDHTAVNEKATALAKKLGVTPEESDTSKSLKSGGETQVAKLKTLKGAEFDKAYVDNEVSYHEAVIGVLDKTLVPNTKNAELKSLLESARPIFIAHLEHAKMVQKSLNQ